MPGDERSKPDEGFFGRWSRRKVRVRESGAEENSSDVHAPLIDAPMADAPSHAVSGALQAAAATAAPAPAASSAIATAAASDSEASGAGELTPRLGAQAHEAPAPTLDDVHQLTPASDFTRFVARTVPDEVRNAALKKLLADPHYNVMDGLDTYIDDYNVYEPMTRSALSQLRQARELGLLDDELAEQPLVAGSPAAQSVQTPAPHPAPQEGSPSPAQAHALPVDGVDGSAPENDAVSGHPAQPMATQAPQATPDDPQATTAQPRSAELPVRGPDAT